MYIKLNSDGYIVGFNSRPAHGTVAVERSFYSRAKTRYTSESMRSRGERIEIAFDPEDLYDSVNTVRSKMFGVFKEMVAKRLNIDMADLVYSQEVDLVSEAFRQVYLSGYLKADPIGATMAWSMGKLYDPAKPYVAPEAEETEDNEPSAKPDPETKATSSQDQDRQQESQKTDREESKATESPFTKSDEQGGEAERALSGDKEKEGKGVQDKPKRKRKARRKPTTEESNASE